MLNKMVDYIVDGGMNGKTRIKRVSCTVALLVLLVIVFPVISYIMISDALRS